MSDTTKYIIRCGCGQGAVLTSLMRDFNCRNCSWPVVYASKWKDGTPVEWTLSRHVSVSIRWSRKGER